MCVCITFSVCPVSVAVGVCVYSIVAYGKNVYDGNGGDDDDDDDVCYYDIRFVGFATVLLHVFSSAVARTVDPYLPTTCRDPDINMCMHIYIYARYPDAGAVPEQQHTYIGRKLA